MLLVILENIYLNKSHALFTTKINKQLPSNIPSDTVLNNNKTPINMILQYWLQEFEHESENTRKLLQSIPQKDLGYRPSDISWTMGELAQHIATIYYWYVGALTQDVYDIASDHLERGSPNDIQATLALFEDNVQKAREALSTLTEEQLSQEWTMTAGDRVVLGPMPRG